MALIPLFYDYNPWEVQRSRYEPDVFGRGITPKEIHQLHSFPRWTNSIRQDPQIFSPTTIGKDGFQVCIDVKQFQPNEITVKTIDNNVVVEGKHEDREDEHGFIARHFVRKYILPKGYDSQHVVSTLSSDGILTIKVPLPSKDIGGNERIVQIQHTGPARLHVKEHKPEANGENGQAKQ